MSETGCPARDVRRVGRRRWRPGNSRRWTGRAGSPPSPLESPRRPKRGSWPSSRSSTRPRRPPDSPIGSSPAPRPKRRGGAPAPFRPAGSRRWVARRGGGCGGAPAAGALRLGRPGGLGGAAGARGAADRHARGFVGSRPRNLAGTSRCAASGGRGLAHPQVVGALVGLVAVSSFALASLARALEQGEGARHVASFG